MKSFPRKDEQKINLRKAHYMKESRSPNLAKFQMDLPTAIASMADRMASSQLSGAFEPSEYDVICGRGRGNLKHRGNKRFKAIVQKHLSEYQVAKTKLDKSAVLNLILEEVRKDEVVKFVSKDKGKWFEVADEKAREKIGHCIREAAVKHQKADQMEHAKQLFERKHRELFSKQVEIFKQLVKEQKEETISAREWRPDSARAA